MARARRNADETSSSVQPICCKLKAMGARRLPGGQGRQGGSRARHRPTTHPAAGATAASRKDRASISRARKRLNMLVLTRSAPKERVRGGGEGRGGDGALSTKDPELGEGAGRQVAERRQRAAAVPSRALLPMGCPLAPGGLPLLVARRGGKAADGLRGPQCARPPGSRLPGSACAAPNPAPTLQLASDEPSGAIAEDCACSGTPPSHLCFASPGGPLVHGCLPVVMAWAGLNWVSRVYRAGEVRKSGGSLHAT